MAEIVIADGRDDGNRLSKPGSLAGIDGRRTGREGAGQRLWLPKPLTFTVRHDLDKDLSDYQNLLHESPCFRRPHLEISASQPRKTRLEASDGRLDGPSLGCILST